MANFWAQEALPQSYSLQEVTPNKWVEFNWRWSDGWGGMWPHPWAHFPYLGMGSGSVGVNKDGLHLESARERMMRINGQSAGHRSPKVRSEERQNPTVRG